MSAPFRIFISSPGDVGQERVIASRVIQRLQGEFSGHVQLEAVLWEHEPTRATTSFQEQIELPSKMDVVICILWSRLGTRLPQGFERRPDDTPYESGTAFEFEDAKRAYETHGKPALLVYRKTAEPLVSLRDRRRLQYQQEQWEALERYLHRWFVDKDGSYKAGFTQFETTDAFEQQLERHLRRLILDAIQEMHVVGETGAVTWHRGSPFRGLEVFEFEHAPVFFGRTRAISEIREALVWRAAAGTAFVLIIGMSGSGKSSFIRAGVLPTITHPGVIEGVGLWRWGIFRPSDAPTDLLRGVACVLLDRQVLPDLTMAGATIEALAEAFKRAPQQATLPIRMGLKRAAEDLAIREQLTTLPEARLVLVIDQMEEIFTLDGLTRADREGFIALLVALASSGVVWVIGSMRSDFYHRAAELPALIALVEGRGQYHLLPPRHAEIRQIIREPTRAAGLTFEQDAATGISLDAMLEEVAAHHPEALPLLEFTLDELFKQRSASGVLTMAAYYRLGGLEGALGRRAEEAFQSLSEAEKAAVPGVIRALVTVPLVDDGWMTARTTTMRAFPEGTPGRAMVNAFLSPEVRLLVADGDGEEARVRVAHEALFSVWERARDIIRADREFLRVRQRVEMSASRWKEEDRHEDLLLSPGKPLAEAEDLLDQRRAELSPEVIEYIETSSTVQHEKARLAREVAEREAETARLLTRRRQSVTRARRFAFLCLCALLVLRSVDMLPYLETAQNALFDFYQRIKPRAVEHLPVVIIDIDDDSLQAFGQWPWPRTRLARLVEATRHLGAIVVALDLFIDKADRLSPSNFIVERPDVSLEIQNALAMLPSNDAILAQTLRHVPSVVGRVGLHEPRGRDAQSDWQTPVRVHGDSPHRHVQPFKGHITSIPQIEDAASGRGYLNGIPDEDGVVRAMPLLVTVDGKLAPTLALEVLRVAADEKFYSVHGSPKGVHGVQIGTSFIPTDSDARIRLYFSPAYSERRISALAILNGTAATDTLTKRVALIGVTALGISDVVATPVDPHMDGVEIQVQLIETVLSGERLVRPTYAFSLETGVSALVGLMILFVLSRLRLMWRVVVIVGITALIVSGAWVAFAHFRLLLDATFPVSTTVFVYVIAISGGDLLEYIQPHCRSS